MIKELPRMLAVCLLMAMAIPAMAQNVQLLQNGDVELWANGPNFAPTHWSNVMADSIFATQENTIIHGGRYSVNITWITPTQANAEFLSDPIPVIAGSVYSCTTWVYDNDIAGQARISFRYNTGNEYATVYSQDVGWQELTYSSTAPPLATSVRVLLRCYDYSAFWDGNATIYADDMVLWGPQFQGNAPPSITNVLRYPYPIVYAGDIVTTVATIMDPDGTIASDSAYHRVVPGSFSGASHDSIAANSAYWFTIGSHFAGDSVEYYIVATDNQGGRTQSPTRGYTVVGSTPGQATIYSLQHTTNQGVLPNCFPSDSSGIHSIRGVVSGRYENPTGTYHKRFFLQEAGAPWSGVYVYNSLDTVQIGDSLQLTGVVSEYYAETEFSSIVTHSKIASGRPVPAPVVVTCATFGPDSCSSGAEPFEGVLIQINNLTVIDTAGNGDFWATDGSGDSCVIMDDVYSGGSNPPTITVGQHYTYVKGIGRYTFGTYRIAPRFAPDVLPSTQQCTGGNIFNVELSFDPGSDTADCWPSPDTGQMVTVCGIVTAVTQGTAPRLFMQDQSNTAWGGIYVYDFRLDNGDTIHTAVGDYIQLTSRVKEYYGWTELDSVTAFTLLGSSQPLPDTTVITISNLTANCDYTTEPYENILVRLNNVTVISDNGFGELWIHDASSADSIRIENDLWVNGLDQPNPFPSPGAVYNYIIGVAKWQGRQGAGYDRGWMIQPRIASDFEQAVIPEPNVVDVWPINNSTLAATFDRVMDPVTTGNPANYSTNHGLSIIGANLDPTNHRKVILTTGNQPNNAVDSLVVVNVCDSTGLCMTTPHRKLYHSGITSISIVQTPNAGGDSTIYIGDLFTVKGVVTSDSSTSQPSNIYTSDQSGPPYRGIHLYVGGVPGYRPFIGDSIIVTGRAMEYFQETELSDVSLFGNMQLVGSGPAPTPYQVSTSQLMANGERFESDLVTVCDSFIVTNINLDNYGFVIYSVTTPAESLIVDKNGLWTRYTYAPVSGDTIKGITGVYKFDHSKFRISPRTDADFNSFATWCGGGGCHYVVGDVNNNGSFNGIDVTYGVSYFKGGNPPPYSCECTPGSTWFVGGDVNGSCVFNGIDITYMVSYFKGGAAPRPCPNCPPTLMSSPGGETPTIVPELKARRLSDGQSQE